MRVYSTTRVSWSFCATLLSALSMNVMLAASVVSADEIRYFTSGLPEVRQAAAAVELTDVSSDGVAPSMLPITAANCNGCCSPEPSCSANTAYDGDSALFCEFGSKLHRLRCCWDGLCNCGCDPCCKKWTVGAGMIYLAGPNLGNRTIVRDLNGNSLVDGSDYNLGYQGGPYFDLIRHGECFDIEFRYFEVDEWSGDVGPMSAPNGSFTQFLGAMGTFAPSTLSSHYGSELRSMELNLRRNMTGWLTVLAGFRYLEIDDNLTVSHFIAPGSDNPVEGVATQNRLYGFQLGVDAILWQYNRFRIEGFAKGGVYGNVRGVYAYGETSTDYLSSTYRDRYMSLIGEAGLFGVYQINNCLAIRGGYQGLWGDGLMTSASATSFIVPGLDLAYVPSPPMNGSDTNFYHGATVTIDYSWCGKRGFAKDCSK